MSNNELGFAYENEVIEALKTAGIAGNITEGAGASASDSRLSQTVWMIAQRA
jgi:hypothetical protein